ncbi:hypothetical protein SI65_05651 [Aspergillus cristatus]|uniref:DNA-directed RNA polymerase I subunit RPA34.5 n=1 Tax=Aspergillus cristatus TaxID=573508 RepID=A0A1E3BDK3_ASPCR|nr:hypothetical protein SI65_05651 [Aspergillus cristatus]
MAVVKQEPRSSSPASESEESGSSRSSSPVNVKQEAEESSSGESESESGSDASSQSESGESGSESESESESEEEASAKEEEKSEEPTKKKSNVSFIEPQAFKPPSGFKSAKKQSSSSNVSSLLSNLRGKQVFHITAPSFLPLSKVKEISLAKVMQGEPVLQHDGVKYGIPADSISQGEADGKTLFLHDSKTQKYHSTPASNIQSYHVQELISIPESNGPTSIAAQDYEKPPRTQPKHLKMRFRPVGSGEGPAETIGTSSESEGEDEKPTFKVPKGSSEKEERKRKHHHTEGDSTQATAAPRKKSKKHSSGDKIDVDEKSEKKKSSKSKDEKKRKKAEKA